MNFFSEEIIEKIKQKEIGIKIFKNLFDVDFINDLNNIRLDALKAKIERQDATKVPFDFNEHELFTKLYKNRVN